MSTYRKLLKAIQGRPYHRMGTEETTDRIQLSLELKDVVQKAEKIHRSLSGLYFPWRRQYRVHVNACKKCHAFVKKQRKAVKWMKNNLVSLKMTDKQVEIAKAVREAAKTAKAEQEAAKKAAKKAKAEQEA
jgi:hypothetical protein